MKIFTLKFNCENAAFEEDMTGEIGRILKNLAKTIEWTGIPHNGLTVYDLNGNRVGTATFEDREEV